MKASFSSPARMRKGAAAFTLIELLVVLAIMGVLATITIPAMKGMRHANVLVSAGRQLVDDIALARARAISERTTVHIVFVPSEILNWNTFSALGGVDGDRDRKVGARLKTSIYSSYALFAERSVGDQPGRPRFRYLTSWRNLPDGILIQTNKFINNAALLNLQDDYARPFEYIDLPFPSLVGNNFSVPHMAFDPQGRLVNRQGQLRLQNEVIPLSRGSLLYTRDAAGNLDLDIRESVLGTAAATNFHRVVVDGLTGRARVETPQIQ